MRYVADHWYSSGTFLGVAGIAAAVLFGILGIWAAFYAANPRQELAWQIRSRIALLNENAHLLPGVEVTVDGEAVKNPVVMELRVFNRGRRDIPSTAFDKHRPLRINVGGQVKKHLDTFFAPENPKPSVVVDGDGLNLGPDLIKKRQSVTVLLLLDGDPNVTVPAQTLVDIPVRERSVEVESVRMPALFASSGALAGAGGVAGAVLAVSAAAPEAEAVLSGLAVVAAGAIWATRAASRWLGRRAPADEEHD